MPHIDDPSLKPLESIEVDSKPVPNPTYASWLDLDQKVVILLNYSLIEEAVAEVLGLSNSRSIWTALEAAYNNSFIERIHSLRILFVRCKKVTLQSLIMEGNLKVYVINWLP